MTKNNQGFSNVLIAIVAAIILVAVGGVFYYYQNQTEKTAGQNNQQQAQNSNNEGAPESEGEKTAGDASIEDNLKKIPGAKEAEDLEAIFKQAFSDKYSRVMEDINITIGKKDATHVWGSVRFAEAVGGGWFLGYRESGTWIIVQDGNGTISCETIEPYDFSADMVPECVNAGGELITR